MGKAPVGVARLAKKYNAEIINADSVQVYKKIDIASAKVTEEEKEGIPHHLFDIKEYDEEKEIVDKTISSIENKIRNCEVCNELKITPEDILIKRDIDYINKILYP